MKKVCALIMMMVTIPVMSATMCSKNDAITIMLDPSINGNGRDYNKDYSTWWTSFSYGTISGISACLSSNYGKLRGGYVSDLHDDNKLVVGGEKNGQYCWCRMTHPALSLWAYYYDTGSMTACGTDCANNCGRGIWSVSDLRTGLFGSITQN